MSYIKKLLQHNNTLTYLHDTENALLEIQKQRDTIKFEQERNQRIINSLYFYEDRFAVASKRITTLSDTIIKYGFIDKLGNSTIPYKYDYASSFDKLGFAKVKYNGYDYLIDTKGNEYRATYDIKKLDNSILALDLRNKQINKLSSTVYQNTQLQILILPDDNPVKLSSAIEKMVNLKIIELGISRPPSKIESLTSLKSLNRRIVQIPIEYTKPTGSNINGIKSKFYASVPKNDWIVHSDRDNNLTYTSPNGEIKNKIMNFMESFYVIGETDTHVELIKYDPNIASPVSRKVNMKKADYYGWAEKRKLLLWRNSLVNKQTDFTIKALIGHSITDMVKGISTYNQLTLYNSPTIEANTENDNDVRLFEFLYVFKEENNKYLVGIYNKLSHSTGSQEVIKGWISEKNVQIWSQRLCIEPNDAPAAAAERRAKGIKTSLFNNYQAALAFKTGTKAQYDKILWDKDKYETGYPSSWKRMPVISKLDNNIYKTGVITDIFSKSNRKVLSAEEHASLEAQYNTVIEKKQNINVVFVIDGTQSNHSFFVPIINAIQNSVNLFKNSYKKYRIGTVIYGKSGEGVVDSYSLTSKYSSVIQSLKNYRDKPHLSQDNDNPTDLYEGIIEATKTLNSEYTNIIVLIGDAGDSLSTNNTDIIQRMKDTECGLISFQTRNVKGLSERIYNEFVNQTKELIVQSSIRSGVRPKLYHDGHNTFQLRYPIESLLPGSLTRSDKGGAMSQAELEEEIRTMLTSFEKQHDQLLRDLDCKIYIDCKPGINEAILEHFLKEIPDIDSTTLRKIRDMDYQLFVEAYVPLRVDDLEYPLFKHAIFMTRQELNELERELEKIVDIGNTPSELREQIINSYKQILIGYYGTEARREITIKSPAEILEIVTGLPTTSELLNKYTIAEIEDRGRVSDEEIQDIFFYMDEKLRALSKIIGNPDYFFRSRDQTYYWVPQEVLP